MNWGLPHPRKAAGDVLLSFGDRSAAEKPLASSAKSADNPDAGPPDSTIKAVAGEFYR